MPQLILILIKINLVLLLFAAGYYLVLRRLTFYTLNRIFLALGIVFSSVYPFIDLTELFYSQKNLPQQVARIVPQLQEEMKNLVHTNPLNLFWDSLVILFWLGTAVMALRLLMQFISLYRIHRQSEPGTVKGYPVRMLKQDLGPFSFWQTIYINPSLHPKEEIGTILEHEHIHVKQWHTLDIILAELSLVFYWFNPGVWLMKKAVRENIEFITDARILRKGIDRKKYQYSLLDVGQLTASPALVNNFNLSDLKKRIRMMNAQRSSRVNVYRYLLLLPALMVLTLSFTVSKKAVRKHIAPIIEAFTPAATKQSAELQTLVKRQKPKPLRNKAAKPRRNNVMTAGKRDSVQVFVFHMEKTEIPDSLISEFPLRFSMSMAGELVKRRLQHLRDSMPPGEGARKIHVELQQKAYAGAADLPLPPPGAEKRILVKAVGRISRVTDSIPAQDHLTYYLNGEEISREELSKKLSSGEIKNVLIKRNPEKPGLYVETKPN